MRNSMKYITHAEYCRASNLAGNVHLDKVLPPEKRKLFPFHWHTNFHLSVLRRKGEVTKPIPSLVCGHCGEELADNGNGSYYTGYIVFDSMHEFYACCYECRPENSMDYHLQIYGHREHMKVMENGKVFDWVNEKHLAVFYRFMDYSNGYKLWNYPDGLKSVAQAREVLNPGELGGGSYENGFLHSRHLKLERQNRDFEAVWSLTEKQTLALINEIIAHNFQRRNNPVVLTTENQLIPGTQLTLF